jgi:hypothetical protein
VNSPVVIHPPLDLAVCRTLVVVQFRAQVGPQRCPEDPDVLQVDPVILEEMDAAARSQLPTILHLAIEGKAGTSITTPVEIVIAGNIDDGAAPKRSCMHAFFLSSLHWLVPSCGLEPSSFLLPRFFLFPGWAAGPSGLLRSLREVTTHSLAARDARSSFGAPPSRGACVLLGIVAGHRLAQRGGQLPKILADNFRKLGVVGMLRVERPTGLVPRQGLDWQQPPVPAMDDLAAMEGRADGINPKMQFSKQFRRVATRFEKTARNYRAVVTLAAIVLWLR